MKCPVCQYEEKDAEPGLEPTHGSGKTFQSKRPSPRFIKIDVSGSGDQGSSSWLTHALYACPMCKAVRVG